MENQKTALAGSDALPCYASSCGRVTLYHGDCESIVPTLKCIDALVTDPPYPNFLVKEYGEADIRWMEGMLCLQLVFWTVKEPFPMDYSARHVWHKQCGTWATEEAIYERNGASDEVRYSYQKIKNKIDAQMNRDVMTGHPSQKPIRLMMRLMERVNQSSVVLDPYMGSGSTGVAAIRSGMCFVGIEKDQTHYATAMQRIKNELSQMTLDL